MEEDQQQFEEKRIIKLPKGGELEVQMTQEFIDRVKSHFKLAKNAKLEDDHVRMFVFGATKTAIDKVTKVK